MTEPSTLASGMRTILNAVENASIEPVTPADVEAILRGEGGRPSHLRAVFGDVAYRVLDRVGAQAGIEPATILAAYRDARKTAAAANSELDALLDEPWSAASKNAPA